MVFVVQCHPGPLVLIEDAFCENDKCGHSFSKVYGDNDVQWDIPVALPEPCIRANKFVCQYCQSNVLIATRPYVND